MNLNRLKEVKKVKRNLVAFITIIFILVGCSNDEAYNHAIQKGLDHLASEEYQKAESAFELALKEEKEDKRATALLTQTVNYQEGLEAVEASDIERAKERLNEVIDESDGSDALVKKAKAELESLEELKTELDEKTKEYESALEQFEEKRYNEAAATVDALLEADYNSKILHSLKDDVEELKKDIEVEIAAEKEKEKKEQAEKAEEERKEKEKVAQEQAKKDAAAKEAEVSKKAFTYEEAISIAEKEYGNEDTGFTASIEPNFENGKAYFAVRAYSISMQEAGGSGTLMWINVFEDGTIIEQGW